MLSRTLHLSSAALIALALAAAATPARAQGAQTQATGRTLFNEGVTLFNKGEYDAACPRFEASLKALPGIGTRGKLAECYEKQGRLASAWRAYREVAQLALTAGEPTREQVASARAKGLEPKLSYLVIVVPPGHDVTGLVVKRNGLELDRAKLGATDPVDAGTVTIELSAPGRKASSAQVAVAQGQSARFEVPALESLSLGPTTTAAPRPSPPPSREPLLVVYTDPPSWQRPVGVAMVAVGVVGLGVGGVLGLSAKAKYDGAFNGGGCDRATKTCDAPGQSAIDCARSAATVSTITFVAGGVLALAGGVVFLTAPSSRPRAMQLAPTTYAGGAGLSLTGSL
jgi:hypothetical protein